MAKFKQIYLDIYKRNLFIFDGNHIEFLNWLNNEFKNDKEYQGLIKYANEVERYEPLASFWYNPTIGEGIIEIPKLPKTAKEIAYCAHECLHAVFHVLDYVGVKYDENSSVEAHTYFLEYLMNELLTFDTYKNV